MKIAYVTETWVPSVDGVVTRLAATLGELHRKGWSTLVIAPDGREPRRAPGEGVIEVPSVRLPPFLGGGKPLGIPLGRRVEDALEEYQPDLVHVVNPFVLGMAGVRAARRAGLPLVASFHQDIAAVAKHYHLGGLGGVIWAHVRRLHAAAELNLVTSHTMHAELSRHRIGRLALWPYGVDLERFHPRRRRPEARRALLGAGDPGQDPEGADRAGGVVALYVGRLAVEKDLQRLTSLARTPGVTLVVVGDGPLRAGLEAEMAGPNVRFTGWLAGDDLADAYAGADVFVFPSTTETLGLVLVEAMASGLPVVAAQSAPSAEILGNGASGVLLDTDQWDQLPAVVRGVADDRTCWAERSVAARRRAEGWGWANATEVLVELYRGVLDGKRA